MNLLDKAVRMIRTIVNKATTRKDLLFALSKVTYSGLEYNVVPDGMIYEDGRSRYHIFDGEGYRRINNFNKSSLTIYQRAIELMGEDSRTLKIVLDFAPYTTDGSTITTIDGDHSLWAKPEYEELHTFWELYGSLNTHSNVCERSKRNEY